MKHLRAGVCGGGGRLTGSVEITSRAIPPMSDTVVTVKGLTFRTGAIFHQTLTPYGEGLDFSSARGGEREINGVCVKNDSGKPPQLGHCGDGEGANSSKG